jgi:hypothetical protein
MGSRNTRTSALWRLTRRLLLLELLEDLPEEEHARDRKTIPTHDALLEEVVGRAEGVPYFLVSCAQQLHAVPHTVPHAVPHTVPDGAKRRPTLPWDVAQSILARASALGAPTLEVLRAAAVIGRIAPHALLAAVMAQAGQSERDLIAALERADHARLLIARAEESSSSSVRSRRRSPHAIRYQFAHDLAREAILADLVPAKRLMLHRAVAEAIERLPEGERVRWVVQLADHYIHADEPARALPYTVRAAHQAMAVFAHAEAERIFHAASQLARDVGDRQRERVAHEGRARACYLLKRFDDALDSLAHGIALCRALGDTEGEARMVWLLGWAHVRRGTSVQGLTQHVGLIIWLLG